MSYCSQNSQKERDSRMELPIRDKHVLLSIDTMQGFCVVYERFYTLLPSICHPSFGYIWRLMRTLSRLLAPTPARFLEDVYAISHSSLLRIDREVLDRIRRSIMKNPSHALRHFMKGKRFILLRGRKKIGQDARADLRELYVLNREFHIAYLLKQDF